MKLKYSLLSLAFGFFVFTDSINSQSSNWYQGERTAEKPFNIGTDMVYEKLLKGRQSREVIVAVIDSGVDIEHEDLKDVIWVNHDEVPDNGIDDDNNGYVDDMHGWNFIGGKNGTQIKDDTYEMTRLYAKYRKKYNDRNPATLKGKELEEYNDFVKFGKRIERETKKAKKQYDEIKEQYDVFARVVDHIDRLNETFELDQNLVDSLSTSFNANDAIAANIFNYYIGETGVIPSAKELREDLVDPLEEGLEHFGSKFKYNWNPDFNPRHLVGDNYGDIYQRNYGNNLVEGPDAFHGTHVSGTIAAKRNNDIGMNGVADNVRIMVLRAVPNGDERDKDVANSIRYAVENGASVINMSFGKGASPHKQLVDDAIRFAEKNDVLIVQGAGNDGHNVDDQEDEDEHYPNDYFLKPKGFLFFRKKQPKNYIIVGASTPSKGEDMAADFSNYGQKDVDIFAPGVMIYSTIPDNKYKISQGTSMAAPIVTGTAALIRSYFPSLSAKQVKEVLLESTTPDNTMVIKPGSEEKVPFSELSVTGGIINIPAAVSLAGRTKGKKKIKKVEVRA